MQPDAAAQQRVAASIGEQRGWRSQVSTFTSMAQAPPSMSSAAEAFGWLNATHAVLRAMAASGCTGSVERGAGARDLHRGCRPSPRAGRRRAGAGAAGRRGPAGRATASGPRSGRRRRACGDTTSRYSYEFGTGRLGARRRHREPAAEVEQHAVALGRPALRPGGRGEGVDRDRQLVRSPRRALVKPEVVTEPVAPARRRSSSRGAACRPVTFWASAVTRPSRLVVVPSCSPAAVAGRNTAGLLVRAVTTCRRRRASRRWPAPCGPATRRASRPAGRRRAAPGTRCGRRPPPRGCPGRRARRPAAGARRRARRSSCPGGPRAGTRTPGRPACSSAMASSVGCACSARLPRPTITTTLPLASWPASSASSWRTAWRLLAGAVAGAAVGQRRERGVARRHLEHAGPCASRPRRAPAGTARAALPSGRAPSTTMVVAAQASSMVARGRPSSTSAGRPSASWASRLRDAERAGQRGPGVRALVGAAGAAEDGHRTGAVALATALLMSRGGLGERRGPRGLDELVALAHLRAAHPVGGVGRLEPEAALVAQPAPVDRVAVDALVAHAARHGVRLHHDAAAHRAGGAGGLDLRRGPTGGP